MITGVLIVRRETSSTVTLLMPIRIRRDFAVGSAESLTKNPFLRVGGEARLAPRDPLLEYLWPVYGSSFGMVF